MTKEDKQIIDRAVKEEWRTGDRSRLKRLLEKNLELYRENVELESKLEQTEKDLADYQFNYPKIKELEKENAELKKQLDDVDNATDCFNKQEEIIDKAKEIIKKIEKIFYSGEEAVKRLSKISDILEQSEQFLQEIEK